MAGLDLSSFDPMLKEGYLEDVAETLNNKVVLLHRIEKTSEPEDFEGRRGVMAIHKGRNSGVGARAERAILPAAGKQSYTNAYFSMANLYGVIELTGQVIAQAKTNAGAFGNALDKEIRGMVDDVSQDMNRQLFGDRTGVLADPTGTSASASQALDTVQYLDVDMVVDFVNVNDGSFATNGQNRTISAIDLSTKTITVDVAVTPTSNTRVVRHGSYGQELWGLSAIIDSSDPATIAGATNYFGLIQRSTSNNFWKAQEVDKTSSPALGLDDFETVISLVDKNSPGEVSLILSDYDQYRYHANLITPDRRYPTANGEPSSLDGGYKAIDYNGIPHLRDKHCPPQTIYFLDESRYLYFTNLDWEWIDDGSILRKVPNQDVYEGTLKAYKQLGCSLPSAQGKLVNLAA